MRDLRAPGVLIALGLIGVVAGIVASIVSLIGRDAWYEIVSIAAPLAGFAIACLAGWRWITSSQSERSVPQGPNQWMALGSVVVAAGWAALTYSSYENHQAIVRLGFPGRTFTALLDPHYRLRMAGGSSAVVGLLLAGLGFWIASRVSMPSVAQVDGVVAAGKGE